MEEHPGSTCQNHRHKDPASSPARWMIGGSRAAMAMIAAEVLGVEVTDVRPVLSDPPTATLVDVRTPGEFDGTVKIPPDTRFGHPHHCR